MTIKSKLIDFFIIFGIFILDRFSKIIILRLQNINEVNEIIIASFLSLNLIWNEGIAFGLFSFEKKLYYNILTIIIILITLIILWMITKTKGLEKISFMMIFGGSIGNIFDRIHYSAVPDFIDFHINNFHWFIFNVADIFITLGVISLIIIEITSKYKI